LVVLAVAAVQGGRLDFGGCQGAHLSGTVGADATKLKK
jgi:hypothetical protein